MHLSKRTLMRWKGLLEEAIQAGTGVFVGPRVSRVLVVVGQLHSEVSKRATRRQPSVCIPKVSVKMAPRRRRRPR